MATSLTMSAGPAFDAARRRANRAADDPRRRAGVPGGGAPRGIRRVVILEVVIDVEGRVTDARVLRSLPMLDGAAVAAVRQWR